MDNTNNPNARERLLRVAEEIFVEQDYDAVSVRALTEAAGVNLALVNYYFGSKRSLYLEVLTRRFEHVAADKCARLRQFLKRREPVRLRGILEAYVDMHLGSAEKEQDVRNFIRLVSRQLVEDGDAMELLQRKLVKPIHQLLVNEIAQLRSDLAPERISFCVSSVTGQIFHYIRCPETFHMLAGHPPQADLREKIAAHIVNFSLCGLEQESP